MGYEAVKKFFEENGINNEIVLLDESSATVELAAKALGRKPGEIAKTLAMEHKDGSHSVLVVMGTARIDNHKYKERFACKPKMLSLEETLAVTGHPVGGVCPFGLNEGVSVYLDESLLKYEIVFPAAGTPNSAVGFTPADLQKATNGIWVDIAQDTSNQ